MVEMVQLQCCCWLKNCLLNWCSQYLRTARSELFRLPDRLSSCFKAASRVVCNDSVSSWLCWRGILTYHLIRRRQFVGMQKISCWQCHEGSVSKDQSSKCVFVGAPKVSTSRLSFNCSRKRLQITRRRIIFGVCHQLLDYKVASRWIRTENGPPGKFNSQQMNAR